MTPRQEYVLSKHVCVLTCCLQLEALKEGDAVKLDLGVHIDGFIAVVAHSLVVGAAGPQTGRRASVFQAAYTAAEVSHACISHSSVSVAARCL